MLLRYARTQFVDPNKDCDDWEKEVTNFYDDDEEEQDDEEEEDSDENTEPEKKNRKREISNSSTGSSSGGGLKRLKLRLGDETMSTIDLDTSG